jgi:hypothetical protein
VRAIELDGEIESTSGSCPAITFVLRNRTVYTTSTTTIRRGPCRDLRRGTDVTVKGFDMSDGRVRADDIRIEDD